MIILSSANLQKDIEDQLKQSYQDLDFLFYPDIEAAADDLPRADVLITYGEDLTEKEIEIATNLKWIMVISAGMDEMPFEAIAKRDIMVTNARGIHAIPMAEYVMHMMLFVSRQTEVVLEQEEAHVWDRSPVMNELHSQTIGILGAGAIGKEVARLAKAFRMNVVGVNRSGDHVEPFDTIIPIENLAEEVGKWDFLVSILPKTDATSNLLDKAIFTKMKHSATIINIGRGNVVHEEDMIEALDNRDFHHAVLDVFNEEPLSAEHPFWAHPHITVTPHLSGISPMYQPRAIDIFTSNLDIYLNNEKTYTNLVDPKKGY
ncbi:D-2-hydroxyacid dehydrogenase [Paenalkalicoccus suaedae]|uniref:D-2-hydroxyacid dehydrogenase n=1 Tax=Paenalkalicoccus suaedae TaxID=2592382 RepID=A0A859FD02_9BACI|nr:D-2-hydroxyacid dehydrogenase [Paenalkalicoccus suaedae]QKS70632.1 D-2-hydroxyacid dehydrogenase [Paenalkalicoccus suaedae]